MTIGIRGAQVYYEQHGQGKPLLLLHGWGCDTKIWQSVVRDFEGQRQLTAFDFPGHGQSSEPPEPWAVTEYMEMTAQLIGELGISGCDIIAHSFGGRVAILLSATYPELVGRLILTGCAGLIKKADGKGSARTRRYKRLRALCDNGLTRALLGEAAVERFRQALRQRYGSADYRALRTDRMRATFNRVIAQDLQGELPKIRASTLLVYGDLDQDTPLWMGQVMEKAIPDAALIVLEGAGHYAFLEQYARFRAIAASFFDINL